MNGELENELLNTIRARQRDEKKLQEMDSVLASLELANRELDETAGMFKKWQLLKKEYAEIKSENELLKLENEDMRNGIAELKALVDYMKSKPAKDSDI
jgi:hypothetical protein